MWLEAAHVFFHGPQKRGKVFSTGSTGGTMEEALSPGLSASPGQCPIFSDPL